MRLIVTTGKGLFLYDYDADKTTPLPRGTPEVNPDEAASAFGISWTHEYMYVGWRRPDEIIEYDKDLCPTGRVIAHPNRLGDIHQILCKDGKMWVTSCGYNTIHVYDCKTLALEAIWNPSEGHDEEELGTLQHGPHAGKYKHWNSIRIIQDRLFLVAHMYDCPPSKVWEFSYPDLRFKSKAACGHHAHNLFLYKGALLATLSSMEGKIFIVQMGEYHKRLFGFFDRDPYFRGICQVGDLSFIGFSGQCLDARHRPSVPGGIIVLDRGDPMFYRSVFNGNGPVMEIRCLDEYDAAHDVGFPFWKKDCASLFDNLEQDGV